MCISVAEWQDASMIDFYERRRRFGSSERWQLQTLLAAGAFRRGCDVKSWSDAVGEFEVGEITSCVYEVRTVKALGLCRWLGFVDQVSVVNAGKLLRDVFWNSSMPESSCIVARGEAVGLLPGDREDAGHRVGGVL